jgi:inactivated superfamily I helicase
LLIGVSRNQAGVDRKSVGADQALCDATLHHALEQPTQRIALAKAPVSVLRERRVIRDSAVQSEPAEPAIRQIEVSLFTQGALGSDAHAVADDQHADH